MSLRLRCTVRDCGRSLLAGGSTLACDAGHGFDRAREGYWNLLQPQDRRSSRPGDRIEALTARRRWLARGFADGLIDTLARALDALPLEEGDAAVDLSCGEGTVTTRLFAGRPLATCGVDLAAPAIRMAARLAPGTTWIVANADRGLPFEDRSVSLAVSIFGRRPVSELARVLPAGGFLVVVVPGADDLIELRAATQGSEVTRDRGPGVLAALAPIGELVAATRWTHSARHDHDALTDALAMSYRGARAPERRRAEALRSLAVTLDAEVLVLRRW